jgi:glutathione S-transferase
MLGVPMSMTRPKLYVLPGSHPCAAVEAALKLKSIAYDRVDLLPSVEQLVGPLRYGGRTVPGMRLDGERLVGSRSIMRRLDQLVPEPALLPPADSPSHAEVLEAERWGDESFQDVPRHVLDVAFLRRPASIESYAGDAKLPLPAKLLRPALPLTARLLSLKSKAKDESARAYLDARRLDRRRAARRRAAQRRRPADRQHDPPAAHDRRRPPADRRPSRCAADALFSTERRRSPGGRAARGVDRAGGLAPAATRPFTPRTHRLAIAPRHAVRRRRYSRR